VSVLILGGPTASGKTHTAIEVAKAYGAHIVSADAMQVYRHMDIGTAKATAEERAAAPHHLIDVRDPDESFDAADFVAGADSVVASGERVIIAGGTSLYLRSFVRGLVQTPRVSPERRAELEALPDLYERLQAVDPVLAERLHPNDRVRLVRGVEVFEASGQRLSELQAEHAAQPDRLAWAGLWLDTSELDERIDRRVLMMVDAGYVTEVERLLGLGYDRALKPMRSLGYRHFADHLLDGLALDEAIRRTQRDTRRFARKQRTWRKHLGLESTDNPVQHALAWAKENWS